ncbi:hypothetical protein BC826DRAFT_207433 [Russula brevipes]|nr:hypothetical protein BC826DRAFT_207433 [Russula brevipes]
MQRDTKRLLTQDARNARDASFHSPASDLISPDLNARLQNVASRIRRSVSQGYGVSPSSIQTQGQGSINDPVIFRSSNDTLHAVFSQASSSALSSSSDRKRLRAESTVDERDDHPDVDTMMQDGVGLQSTSLITANDLVSSRPIKPLRRTPRLFGQTMSLPAAAFASSGGAEDQTFPDVGLEEEEDWSTGAFSGNSLKTQTLL